MIERLRGAASKLRMNKVEVAGFSTAIKEASAVPCKGAGGSRRTMASAELGGSLDLVSSLVGTSKDVGLEGLAAKGMGHSLSSALGSMSEINKARRSVRRALRNEYRQISQQFHTVVLAPESSALVDADYPFQRRSVLGDVWSHPLRFELARYSYSFALTQCGGRHRDPDEYIVGEGMWDGRDEQGTGWGGRRVSNRRKGSSDVLLDTLSGLSASQLGDAVEGDASEMCASSLCG